MKVLFFALLRERLGCSEVEIDSTGLVTVQDVLSKLKTRSDDWQRVLTERELLVAVNQELVAMDTKVQANDEIAFFPPVTGG